MIGWLHRFIGPELGQTQGDGEGQRNLACCCPWGRKESDTTWRLKNNKILGALLVCYVLGFPRNSELL